MLIPCPECGRMMSDKARCCPECGCPNEKFEEPQKTHDVKEPQETNEAKESQNVNEALEASSNGTNDASLNGTNEASSNGTNEASSNGTNDASSNGTKGAISNEDTNTSANEIVDEEVANEVTEEIGETSEGVKADEVAEDAKDESASKAEPQMKEEPYHYKYQYKKQPTKGKGCMIATIIIAVICFLCVAGAIIGVILMLSRCSSSIDNEDFWPNDSIVADTTMYDDSYYEDENYDENEDSAYISSDEAELKGYIGGGSYPITMHISIKDNGDVTGTYTYDNQAKGKILNLTGNYNSPYLTLFEYNEKGENTGKFEGKYDEETFSGSYTNATKQEYAFNLKEIGN